MFLAAPARRASAALARSAWLGWATLLALLAQLGLGPALAAQAAPRVEPSQRLEVQVEVSSVRVTPIVSVVQRAGPGVVNVYQDGGPEAPFPFSAMAPGVRAAGSSLGSGLLIDADGYILTTAHVLPLGTEGIHVSLSDGGDYPATLVGVDLDNDVALLKIVPRAGVQLATLRLGTSSDVMVGETVIAIGNPLGRENDVSTGIISSASRRVRVPTPGNRGLVPAAKDFIQIDALITPGNSGGPVLNAEGDVIGILLAMQTQAQGMGFAIPADRVRRSLAQTLLNPALLSEVVTGFELASGPSGRDVSVSALLPGGPAERAGLRCGDRLLELAGRPVAWEFDVSKALLASQPGDALPLLVARGDERVSIELVLERGESPLLNVWRRLGVRIVDHNRYKGVRVATVDPTGPAARLGLRPGDLIDGVDSRLLDGTDDLCQSLHELPQGTPVVMHVWRGREAWSGPLILR